MSGPRHYPANRVDGRPLRRGRDHAAPMRAAGGSGFTAIELVISMVILSVTALALGATMASVSQGWTATRHVHATVLTQHTAGLRLERLVGGSKEILVGQMGDLLGVAPPATVALWLADDADFGTSPELCETALLSHSRSDRALYLYEFQERNVLNGTKVVLPDVVNLLPQLETLSSNLINIYAVRRRTLARDVEYAAFWYVPAASGGRPSVEFVLRTGEGRHVYGTATLKGAQP